MSIQKREGLRSATLVFFDVRKTLKTKTNGCFLIRTSVAAIKLHKNTDITVFSEPKVFKVSFKKFLKPQPDFF